jgi:MFS transporter, DHA1 family, tetracycline resistance protein
MSLFYSSLKTLPRNAKLTIYLQPLWSIPFFLYNSYMSLYMLEIGLTPKMVGLISSVSILIRTGLTFFAGNIIDRMGRKKSLVLFDAISWLAPLLIWSSATKFWHFLVAGIINSTIAVNGIASMFFLVEDVDRERRLNAFNYMEVVLILSGFFVPVSGLLFRKFSFVPTMRGIYLFAFLCMCVFVLVKYLHIKETSIGERIKSRPKEDNVFKNFVRASKYIIGNRYLVTLQVIRMATAFNATLYGLYYFPLLKKYFNYSESAISVIPFVSSAITLVVLVYLIPAIKNKPFYLKTGLLLYVAGGIALALAPKQFPLVFVVLNIALWAFARSLMNPIMNLETANTIDDETRADVMAAQNILMTLVMFPAGYLGGMLFEISPVYPFYGILILYFAAYIVYLGHHKRLAPGRVEQK